MAKLFGVHWPNDVDLIYPTVTIVSTVSPNDWCQVYSMVPEEARLSYQNTCKRKENLEEDELSGWTLAYSFCVRMSVMCTFVNVDTANNGYI